MSAFPSYIFQLPCQMVGSPRVGPHLVSTPHTQSPVLSGFSLMHLKQSLHPFPEKGRPSVKQETLMGEKRRSWCHDPQGRHVVAPRNMKTCWQSHRDLVDKWHQRAPIPDLLSRYTTAGGRGQWGAACPELTEKPSSLQNLSRGFSFSGSQFPCLYLRIC